MNEYKGPLPGCRLQSDDCHLDSSHTVLHRNEICSMRGQNMSIGFLLGSCTVLMLDWQSALRICSQITRTLDDNTFFCLLRFSGRRSAFTTGASRRLVITQYPRSPCFLLLYTSSCFASPPPARRGDTQLWFNISLSDSLAMF